MRESLSDFYRRWRHTRGFGVHSPLAFSLINNVVRPTPRGYCYYNYTEIDNAAADEKNRNKVRRRARLVHRIAARFVYRGITVLSQIDNAMQIALSAGIKTDKDSRRSLMVVDTPDEVSMFSLKSALSVTGCTAIVFNVNHEQMDELCEVVKNGVLLKGKDTLIAVNDRKIERVEYVVII